MKDKPNGFDLYLVKTKSGATYLVDNPMTKKGVNYYDCAGYPSSSLTDEDIEDWVGVDETTFNIREALIKQTFSLFVEFHKQMRHMKLEAVTPKFINEWLDKELKGNKDE